MLSEKVREAYEEEIRKLRKIGIDTLPIEEAEKRYGNPLDYIEQIKKEREEIIKKIQGRLRKSASSSRRTRFKVTPRAGFEPASSCEQPLSRRSHCLAVRSRLKKNLPKEI